MGLLDDLMQSDNAAFFDTDVFGENVLYRPSNGSARTISAVVNRDVIPFPDEAQAGVREVMIVCVKNHPTEGIPSSSFNSKDKIEIAYRIGETAKSYVLGLPVSIDTAQLVFRVK